MVDIKMAFRCSKEVVVSLISGVHLKDKILSKAAW